MAKIDSLRFSGLVKNRRLKDITGPEFHEALTKAGWREAHNGHILKRLRQRGPACGIKTLEDFGRALKKGTTEEGERGVTVRILPRGGYVVYKGNRFITFVSGDYEKRAT